MHSLWSGRLASIVLERANSVSLVRDLVVNLVVLSAGAALELEWGARRGLAGAAGVRVAVPAGDGP